MSSVVSRNNVLAGVFVVASLMLAVAIAVILGDALDSLGAKHQYVVRFPTSVGVTGLQPGASVTFAGLPVGKVVTITPNAPEGQAADSMDVLIALDARIVLHEDAFADLSPPLLGGVSRINFASAGEGSIAPGSPDAQLASNNANGLLDEGEAVRGRFAPSILAQLGFTVEDAQRIKAAIADVEVITANVRHTSDRVDRMANELEPKFSRALADATDAVADVRTFAGRFISEDGWGGRIENILTSAEDTVAKGPVIVEDVRTGIASARRILDDNAETVSRILGNVEITTERVRFQTMDQAEELLRQGTLALASAKDVADNTNGLITEARPEIGIALTNTRALSQQARLFLDEVRAQPWRLLKQPPQKDLEREPLYAAARSYARAVADLRAASEALDSAVRGTGPDAGSPQSPTEIAKIAQAVQAAYGDYEQAERALLETLRTTNP